MFGVLVADSCRLRLRRPVRATARSSIPGSPKQRRVKAGRRLHGRATAFGESTFRYVSARSVALMVGVAVLALQFKRASTDNVSFGEEGSHLSYVQYVASGNIPHIGDTLNTWVARSTRVMRYSRSALCRPVPAARSGTGGVPGGRHVHVCGMAPVALRVRGGLRARASESSASDPSTPHEWRPAYSGLWERRRWCSSRCGSARPRRSSRRRARRRNDTLRNAAGCIRHSVLGAVALSVVLCGTVLNLMRDRVTWRSGEIADVVLLPRLPSSSCHTLSSRCMIAYLAWVCSGDPGCSETRDHPAGR